MEYFEKGDLQSYLVKPFPEAETQEVSLQVLEGLSFMHDNGFAHRDLKPGVSIYFLQELCSELRRWTRTFSYRALPLIGG